VSVADDQRLAAEPAGDEAAQERQPAGAVLAGDHIQSEDLAVSVAVHADRDHDSDVDDPPALANLLGEGVHPHEQGSQSSCIAKLRPVPLTL
jgi:hypothetical protein